MEQLHPWLIVTFISSFINGQKVNKLFIFINTLDAKNASAIANVFNEAKSASDGYHVEIIMTGESGIIATTLAAESGIDEKSLCLIYEAMRSAKSAGIKINICERSIEWCGLNIDNIIPEIDGIVNNNYITEIDPIDAYVIYL
jgi:predicted peroxiredoxin